MIKHKHIPIHNRVFYQAILDEIKRIDNEANWHGKINSLNEAYIKKVQYCNALQKLKEAYEKG